MDEQLEDDAKRKLLQQHDQTSIDTGKFLSFWFLIEAKPKNNRTVFKIEAKTILLANT